MPLPFPAHTHSPVPIPADRLPVPCAREGVWAQNTLLRQARRLFEGQVIGSESVAVAPDGTAWMMDKWGYVYTAEPVGDDDYCLNQEPLAYVGPGRPLGFHHNPSGDLVFCDSLKGLMLLERPKGGPGPPALRCLTNFAGGRPINYANDLSISSTGLIYFSDSGIIPPALNDAALRPWFDTMRSYMLTMWHGLPAGRLLCCDPATGTTKVLASDLWYANGVALAADESFVAVVETCSMRVRRYWLKGPKAGTLDTLIDRLPGWPDNIVEARDGNFWLCLVLPDMPLVHKILPKPWLRSIVAKLPKFLLPRKPQWGCVAKATCCCLVLNLTACAWICSSGPLRAPPTSAKCCVQVSPEGKVLQVLMDPDGSRVSHVSSLSEHNNKLFLGNLAKDYVSVLDVSALRMAGSSQ